jgi:hypothetical protein
VVGTDRARSLLELGDNQLVPSSHDRPANASSIPTGVEIPRDVLLEDFTQQCTNLQGQYTRMHNRLQLLTGLNTALLPALGTVGVAASKGEVGRAWLLLFPATGLLLSMIGYVAGRNDRWLVTVYRRQLAHTAQQILQSVEQGPGMSNESWLHAGRDPSEVDKLLPPQTEVRPWWDRLISSRLESLSATRLPAMLSIIFAVVWIAVSIVLVSTA